MKILIISDPIETVSPRSDTGLSMLRGALARGHHVFWTTPKWVHFWQDDVHCRAWRATGCQDHELPAMETSAVNQGLADFHTVWIRKDPPFDEAYMSLCWLLSLVRDRTLIVNDPNLLLLHHEKILPLQAHAEGFLRADQIIPTWVGRNQDLAPPANFPDGMTICKPWLGFGGRDVSLHPDVATAFASRSRGDFHVLQPFQQEVKESGDRRVFFINGEYKADFVRMPKSGSIVANLAQGGHAELRPLSKTEESLTADLAAFLHKHKIMIAGADYLGGRLSEVNITAPTGFETLRELGGRDLREEFVECIEGVIALRD